MSGKRNTDYPKLEIKENLVHIESCDLQGMIITVPDLFLLQRKINKACNELLRS